MRLPRASYPTRHVCHRPGWRERRRLGIRDGARIVCECGQAWEWRDTGWTDRWMEWVRINEQGERVWPEKQPDPLAPAGLGSSANATPAPEGPEGIAR